MVQFPGGYIAEIHSIERSRSRCDISLCFWLCRYARRFRTSRRPRPTYNLLRENDTGVSWPTLRCAPISGIRSNTSSLAAKGAYVSLGGETREAFEQAGNDNWENSGT